MEKDGLIDYIRNRRNTTTGQKPSLPPDVTRDNQQESPAVVAEPSKSLIPVPAQRFSEFSNQAFAIDEKPTGGAVATYLDDHGFLHTFTPFAYNCTHYRMVSNTRGSQDNNDSHRKNAMKRKKSSGTCALPTVPRLRKGVRVSVAALKQGRRSVWEQLVNDNLPFLDIYNYNSLAGKVFFMVSAGGEKADTMYEKTRCFLASEGLVKQLHNRRQNKRGPHERTADLIAPSRTSGSSQHGFG